MQDKNYSKMAVVKIPTGGQNKYDGLPKSTAREAARRRRQSEKQFTWDNTEDYKQDCITKEGKPLR
jgi:hypothetical protein